MRGSILLPLLLAVLIVGCKKPEVRTTGSILAGETGNGIRSVVFDPPLVDADNDNQGLSVAIDPERDGPITMDRTNQFNSGPGYSSHSDFGFVQSDINVEFLVDEVLDTVWRCDFYTPSTSTQETAFYNRLSGFSCPGTPVFHAARQLKIPVGLSEGALIGSQGNWEPGNPQLGLRGSISSSQVMGTDTITTVNSQHYVDPSFPTTTSFLPFRYNKAGSWRYGYVKLMLTDARMEIYGFGVEDPAFTEE